MQEVARCSARCTSGPCGYELIEEFKHKESEVVEPGEQVDLRKRGLKGFITAHKEIVTIFINPSGTEGTYQITRGDHTVAEILAKVGQTPEGYVPAAGEGRAPAAHSPRRNPSRLRDASSSTPNRNRAARRSQAGR